MAVTLNENDVVLEIDPELLRAAAASMGPPVSAQLHEAAAAVERGEEYVIEFPAHKVVYRPRPASG